jgi:hypothetical protein
MYTLPTQPHPTAQPLFQINQPIMFPCIAVFINTQACPGGKGDKLQAHLDHIQKLQQRDSSVMVYIQLGINADHYLAITGDLQNLLYCYKQLSSKFESSLTLMSQFFGWDNILLNMYNT